MRPVIVAGVWIVAVLAVGAARRTSDRPGGTGHLGSAANAQIVASMGLDGFDQLSPAMLNRRIEGQRTRTYAEIYDWLLPGELLDDAPETSRSDWVEASADEFT